MIKTKYYAQFLVVCLFSFGVAYGLQLLPSVYFVTSHFWIPTLFFAITTVGINLVLLNSEKNTKEFVFKNLALNMLRLLSCMVFVLIYNVVNKNSALPFACHFMLQYIIFTVFEINVLLTFIKSN